MSIQTPEPVVPESAWFKSSYSSGEGGECLEAAFAADGIRIRDSKHPGGPVLTVTENAWAGLVGLAAGHRIG
ncbi:hypothetical protein DB35_08160 [Streptomyces abyssalis]|uniref:DUF397 domain-containing protein n=1 Tax=Streptomyces abyssalis TaxID=933944 RepID=A0A1E7JSG1_9ACTN|nr:DUF397 domain-containing protein [Streptomyces abyssalis]OEU91787.1 hypothetical protein AN215_04630 [Streptomyces abyssalis]OEU94074.1 hypothetical protein DB35_08160 [Streptomyces abyssalis]